MQSEGLVIVAIVYDLFIILVAGLISGVVAKRLGFSMLVGYLLAGAIIGTDGLNIVRSHAEGIEHIAHAGALLLLFAIGIEFSMEELVRLSRYFFIGGSVQLILVATPVIVACILFGLSWQSALLIGSATALSSTVLVFRALAEWGETASPQGRRTIGVLLFQDVIFIPMMLVLPLLTTGENINGPNTYLLLILNSVLFVAVVLLLRKVLAKWLVPLLVDLRSVELLILFTLIVLVGFCIGANSAGLPPTIGAFAAGLVLGGNRLTRQIDALIIPYRESFGAVLFVSLGMLIDIHTFIESPVIVLAALLAVLVLKTFGGIIALRATSLSWRASAGMGLGLAQLGELSFLLLLEGFRAGLISGINYERMLFVAMGTLIMTPQLLSIGLRFARQLPTELPPGKKGKDRLLPAPREAVVIGLGPIGSQAASQLELIGIDVCLVDLSPVNLYAYAQQSFRTVSGNACDSDVLERANVARAQLVIVCVPEDQVALQIIRAICKLNPKCTVVVRCRYKSYKQTLQKAGASVVVSEEVEASTAMMRILQDMSPASIGG